MRSLAAALRDWPRPMSSKKRARRARRSSTRSLRSGRGWAGRWPRKSLDGAVLERGPDSFLTEKPAAAELCRELGLGDELIPSNDAARKTYIVVAQSPGGAARWAHVPGADQAGSDRADAAVQPAHQDAHGAGAAASAAAQRCATSRLRRWSSGTLARRPSTGSPIRCSAASMAATPRNSARKPCCRAWWRWRRKYGSLTRGMLAAHRKMRAAAKNSSKTQNRGAADLYGAARRHAAVGGRDLSARSIAASVRTATRGERQSRRRRRAGALRPAERARISMR